MEYITGTQALNIDCSLDTCGDWHASGQRWGSLDIAESRDSLFGDWGIEGPKDVYSCGKKYYVANHIRALLDLLERGQIDLAQGMRNDYICNESYTPLVFDMVYRLNESEYWDKINGLMQKEYFMKWINYEKAHKR